MATRGPGGEGGAANLVCDKNGRPRVGMVVNENGDPAMQFIDANGNVRLMLGLGGNGDPFIMFYEDAKDRDGAPLIRIDAGCICLADALDGPPRRKLTLVKGGSDDKERP
jgi:hypothetical protein